MAAGHQCRRSSSQLGPDNLKRGGCDRIPGRRAGKPDSEALKRETLLLFTVRQRPRPRRGQWDLEQLSVSPAALPSFFFLSCARRSVRACPGFGPTGPLAGGRRTALRPGLRGCDRGGRDQPTQCPASVPPGPPAQEPSGSGVMAVSTPVGARGDSVTVK